MDWNHRDPLRFPWPDPQTHDAFGKPFHRMVKDDPSGEAWRERWPDHDNEHLAKSADWETVCTTSTISGNLALEALASVAINDPSAIPDEETLGNMAYLAINGKPDVRRWWAQILDVLRASARGCLFDSMVKSAHRECVDVA